MSDLDFSDLYIHFRVKQKDTKCTQHLFAFISVISSGLSTQEEKSCKIKITIGNYCRKIRPSKNQAKNQTGVTL
ncbi:hypothetical protein LEMLEM_LOCUS8763, partial [Lemmus lemmus]